MAEEGVNTIVNVDKQRPSEDIETTDRGLFDFMKKGDDHKPAQGEVIATEFENKVQVSTPEYKQEEEKKHGGLLEKLHRSDSSSSSSSEDEEDDEETKKRKREKKERKSLKEKLKEKLPGHKDDHVEDTSVPVEKVYEEHKPHVQEVVYSEPSHPAAPLEPEEKKGIIDKLKEKLPGQHKKPEEQDYPAAPVVTPAAPVATEHCPEGEAKEKKGFLDKIKDKIPGFHSKTEEEEKKGEKKESD